MEDNVAKGGYQIRNQQSRHFLTLTVCGWIDLFTRKEYKDILIESLRYCIKEKGLELNAFVIMSNHVHLIARATKQDTLSDILRDLKKFTHRSMMKIIESEKESRRLWMLHQFKFYASRHSRNENYQIWTNDNHPEECFTEDFTLTKLNYIHRNPVRAGIVANAEDYIYSSAANYVLRNGIIDIVLL